MSAFLNPYLNFRGDAKAALEFYQSVLGGELNIMTFGQMQMPDVPAEAADQVMHGQLETADGFTLMGSDVPGHMEYAAGVNTFSVSLSGDDEEKLTGFWDGLLDGATVLQPLEKAPWGDSFGMLHDKFGVAWLVNISGGQQPQG